MSEDDKDEMDLRSGMAMTGFGEPILKYGSQERAVNRIRVVVRTKDGGILLNQIVDLWESSLLRLLGAIRGKFPDAEYVDVRYRLRRRKSASLTGSRRDNLDNLFRDRARIFENRIQALQGEKARMQKEIDDTQARCDKAINSAKADANAQIQKAQWLQRAAEKEANGYQEHWLRAILRENRILKIDVKDVGGSKDLLTAFRSIGNGTELAYGKVFDREDLQDLDACERAIGELAKSLDEKEKEQ